MNKANNPWLLKNYLRVKVLVFLFVVFFKTLSAQNNIDCRIVPVLLNYDKARQTFKFDKFKESPIVFIDNNHKLNGCSFDKFYGRNVSIMTDTTYLNKSDPSIIVIYNVTKNHGKYQIEIRQRYTGAYGYIEFKRTKDTFIVSKFSVGYF